MRRLALLLLAATLAHAQAERAIMQRPATIYLSPDTSSSRLGSVDRGREIAIVEHSRGFVKGLINVGQGQELTGWVLDKGVIRGNTPEGDKVLFGEAVDSEAEAENPHGRKDAAQEAMRLYYRMAEYFPKSPLAGEAAWRAADIRWQIDKQDVRSRKSAREKDAYLREPIDEEWVKEVEKKFPGTRWADMASFLKLDNHVCGEWQGDPKCPEKESEMYSTYADHHPNSPRRDEALYAAAWRQACLVDLYKAHEDHGKSQSAKARAIEFARRISPSADNKPDWAARAARLIYMLENNIAVYGSGME